MVIQTRIETLASIQKLMEKAETKALKSDENLFLFETLLGNYISEADWHKW